MKIILPAYFLLQEKICKNFVYQLGFDKTDIDGTFEEYTFNKVQGFVIRINEGIDILISPKKNWSAHNRFDHVLFAKDFDNITKGDFTSEKYLWIKHPEIVEANTCQEVFESFNGAFSFKKENIENGIEGLRSPQIGGIYATLAHWQIDNEPATIVMPTGTGKTETMLSLLFTANCKKVLIVVPSDALRSQLSKKFINLGLLKKIGIVNEEALFPRVGIMKHRPLTDECYSQFEANIRICTSKYY